MQGKVDGTGRGLHWFSPPARVSAPVLVLVFGLTTTWLNYRWNLADDLSRGQADLRAEADATGMRLARLGEQLHSLGGIAVLQADLKVSVEAPNLAFAAFVDAEGWVLAGSSSELGGRSARQTLLQAAASLMQASLHFGFATRIARLAEAVRGFGGGDRDAIRPLAGSDEVAELSRAFSAMAESVAAHERQHAQTEKQVLEAGERERLRIGHELHDGLGQRLTAAALAADGLASSLADADRSEAGRVTELARQIRAAISETRQLSHGLAPVGIETGGLAAALSDMAAALRAGGTVRVVFESDPPDLACSAETATHLFRIAQEAVTNALRHAAPGEIRIGLLGRDDHLVLEVEDDGSGMPDPMPPEAGIGLRLMSHRAQLLGGQLTIDPSPAGGTLLRCTIPLSS